MDTGDEYDYEDAPCEIDGESDWGGTDDEAQAPPRPSPVGAVVGEEDGRVT